MDVKAYLFFFHSNFEEEIYMKHLEGFLLRVKDHMVCKLKKSLYDLK